MRVLIVDQDRNYRQGLIYHLQVRWPEAVIDEHDPALRGFVSGDLLSRGSYDLILLASPLPDQSLPDALAVFQTNPDVPVVVFAADGDEFLAVEAIRAGARYYFPKDRVRHVHLIDTLEELLRKAAPSVAVDPFDGAEATDVKGYRPLRRLHSGELSVVYLAEKADGDRVVLKLLKQISDEGAERERIFNRFVQEYELIAQIKHPGIVAISELGVADDHAFIAMEYLAAGSLAKRLRAAVAPEQAIDYVRQVAQALQVIHEAGILHRDLKPTNVMLRTDGSLALIDFGLAKTLRLEAAITGSARIFGTPHYMSPEQGYGDDLDARADIYSLGVMLVEMLTGAPPFIGSSAFGVIYQHQQAARPQLPGDLAVYQGLVDGMMARSPSDRFADTKQLLQALPG